jgi:hypothetical protein
MAPSHPLAMHSSHSIPIIQSSLTITTNSNPLELSLHLFTTTNNHHNHVLHHFNTLQLLHPSHPRRFPLRNNTPQLRHGPPHVRDKKPILQSNASHKPRHLEKQTPRRDLEPPGASSRRTLKQLGGLSSVRCGDGTSFEPQGRCDARYKLENSLT